jgi:antirestriction protein
MTTAKIYVGTYAKYNSGSIAGEWLNIEDFSNKEDFLARCTEIHSDESDPEFMFQDHEGIPSGMISESSIEDSAFQWAALDDDDKEMIGAYSECFGDHCTDWSDIDSLLDTVRDSFAARDISGPDFAEQMAEDCGEIPAELQSWIVIDWEASWNCNLRHDYSMTEFNGETWIFRNC